MPERSEGREGVSPTPDKPIETLDTAIRIARDNDYRPEIIAVLERAWVEAIEQREEMDAEGLTHLRTFLKTTPLGLAILDLAHSIIGENAR